MKVFQVQLFGVVQNKILMDAAVQ